MREERLEGMSYLSSFQAEVYKPSREKLLNTKLENCSALYNFISFHDDKAILFSVLLHVKGVLQATTSSSSSRAPSCLTTGAPAWGPRFLPRPRHATATFLLQ